MIARPTYARVHYTKYTAHAIMKKKSYEKKHKPNRCHADFPSCDFPRNSKQRHREGRRRRKGRSDNDEARDKLAIER